MISPVLIITEGMNMKNQNQNNWGRVCCKGKCLKVGEITRKGRSRRMKKYVVGHVEIVVEKNNLLVIFEGGQKRYKLLLACVFKFERGF